MAAYKVEICGVNTSKLPVLKDEEKGDLFSRIKAGDMEARETYIKGNLRLVLSVIKRFSNSNENVDDLFQIGCIGLIKSIDNFNPDIGVKFSTYAVPMNIPCRKPQREKSICTWESVITTLFTSFRTICFFCFTSMPSQSSSTVSRSSAFSFLPARTASLFVLDSSCLLTCPNFFFRSSIVSSRISLSSSAA